MISVTLLLFLLRKEFKRQPRRGLIEELQLESLWKEEGGKEDPREEVLESIEDDEAEEEKEEEEEEEEEIRLVAAR